MTRRTARLILLSPAARSYREEAKYLRQHASDAVAGRWLDEVMVALNLLRQFPLSGAEFLSDRIRNIRRTGIKSFPNHLIFYSYDKSAHLIEVIDILHGARDLESALSNA